MHTKNTIPQQAQTAAYWYAKKHWHGACEQDIEDFVQDVCYKYFRKFPTDTHQEFQPSYCYSVCRSVLVDLFRRTKAKKNDGIAVELIDELVGTGNDPYKAIEYRDIISLIETYSDTRYMKVAYQTSIGVNNETVMKEFGISKSAVQLYRTFGMQQIRRRFKTLLC